MNRTQFTFYESFSKAIGRIKKKSDRADAYDAICAYALYGTEPSFDSVSDAVSIVFELIRPVLDTARKKARGGSNGTPRKDSGKTGERQCKDSGKEKEGEIEKENEIEIENECLIAPPEVAALPDPPGKRKVIRKERGQYGWVKLSDEEYSRLSNDLGETELKRCIAYVDERAQMTGNKNKWRDWNLVIRKCHKEGWGVKPTNSNGAVKTSADYEGGDSFV